MSNLLLLAKLTHSSTFRFHLLHPNLKIPTVPSASRHPTFGALYLPTSELIHPSATKPLLILLISPVRQFHLPSNLYPYPKIVFFSRYKTYLFFLSFTIITFSAVFSIFYFDRTVLILSQTKILTQLSNREYIITLGRGLREL